MQAAEKIRASLWTAKQSRRNRRVIRLMNRWSQDAYDVPSEGTSGVYLPYSLRGAMDGNFSSPSMVRTSSACDREFPRRLRRPHRRRTRAPRRRTAGAVRSAQARAGEAAAVGQPGAAPRQADGAAGAQAVQAAGRAGSPRLKN